MWLLTFLFFLEGTIYYSFLVGLPEFQKTARRFAEPWSKWVRLSQENSEEVDWQKEADTPEGDDWKVKETWLELQGGAPVR